MSNILDECTQLSSDGDEHRLGIISVGRNIGLIESVNGK